MKLLITREQKAGGFTGGMTYILIVRGQFTQDEQDLITRHSLMGELLFYHDKHESTGGFLSEAIKTMRDTRLTTAGLVNGTQFKCKNVGEMLEVEDQIKEACVQLRRYMEAAKHFGGEEVIDIEELDKAVD